MVNGSVGFGRAPLCNRKQDTVAESKSSGLQRPYYRLFHPRDFFYRKAWWDFYLISDIYFPTKLVHGELGPCSVHSCRVSADAHFQSQLWLEAALSFLHGVVKELSQKQCTGSRRAETALALARLRSATATKLCWRVAEQGEPCGGLAPAFCALCSTSPACLPRGILFLLCPRQGRINQRSKVAVASLKHFLPPCTSKSCGPFSTSQYGRWC